MSLLNLLFASLLVNGIFFAVAAVLKTDVFTDITYSMSFILLTVLTFSGRSSYTVFHTAAAVSVIIWALRLGIYLFTRILFMKVDHRFDDKRDSFIKFGSFWILQAITVWIVFLPVYGILTTTTAGRNGYIFLLFGSLLFLKGLIIETAADSQKFIFKKNPDNKGKFISTGLWKYSRHPNYFGEILVWWGISLPGLSFFNDIEYLYFAGPVFITCMLLFVSGIPLLEKSWEEKWGKNPDFVEYRDKTHLLIPLPWEKRKK